MNCRKILHAIMYKDTCDVYRAKLIQIGRTDDYTTEFELVYEKVPCKLSQSHERSTFHNDDVSQKDTLNYVLYFDVDVDICENDKLDVNHEGKVYTLFAGTIFRYPTHTELLTKRRKEAHQL